MHAGTWDLSALGQLSFLSLLLLTRLLSHSHPPTPSHPSTPSPGPCRFPSLSLPLAAGAAAAAAADMSDFKVLQNVPGIPASASLDVLYVRADGTDLTPAQHFAATHALYRHLQRALPSSAELPQGTSLAISLSSQREDATDLKVVVSCSSAPFLAHVYKRWHDPTLSTISLRLPGDIIETRLSSTAAPAPHAAKLRSLLRFVKLLFMRCDSLPASALRALLAEVGSRTSAFAAESIAGPWAKQVRSCLGAAQLLLCLSLLRCCARRCGGCVCLPCNCALSMALKIPALSSCAHTT